jgi:hypothetical protein
MMQSGDKRSGFEGKPEPLFQPSENTCNVLTIFLAVSMLTPSQKSSKYQDQK